MSKFTINGRLPGLNEIIDSSKAHWNNYRQLKLEAMILTKYAIRQHRLKKMTNSKVSLKIACYEPNAKRDPDNVWSGAGKVILDALKQSEIITDDSQKYINGIEYSIGVDRLNPRIEVEIQEA